MSSDRGHAGIAAVIDGYTPGGEINVRSCSNELAGSQQ